MSVCHFCDGKGYISGGFRGLTERRFTCYMCGQTGSLAEDWNKLVEVHPGCWVVKGNKTVEELKAK